MEHEWKYIDEFDAMPDVEAAHVDTRDFYMIVTDQVDPNIDKEISTLSKRVPKDTFEKFLFNRAEILGWLKSLEEGSGGQLKWRMLSFDVGHHKAYKNWCKYIRLRKTTYEGFPCYFAYTTRCNKVFPLRRDVHCQENIREHDSNAF